jgi:hypothetical protein
MKLRILLTCLFALMLGASLIFAGSAAAQSSNGTIVGTIFDKSGAAVPNAKVTASSKELGVTRTTVTDSTGGYRIGDLPPGNYSVSIEASGFSLLQLTDIHVKGSFEVSANANLDVGTVTNTVLVEASAAQELQTESGALGAEISQRERILVH